MFHVVFVFFLAILILAIVAVMIWWFSNRLQNARKRWVHEHPNEHKKEEEPNLINFPNDVHRLPPAIPTPPAIPSKPMPASKPTPQSLPKF